MTSGLVSDRRSVGVGAGLVSVTLTADTTMRGRTWVDVGVISLGLVATPLRGCRGCVCEDQMK